MNAELTPPLERPDSGLVQDLRPSPNHGERKGGRRADMLVLHYTGMPAGRGMTMAERAIRWLATPESQVSCHYVVAEDGRVTQMVAEDRRAWHAGVASWAGERDVNSCSIGIEIAHAGHPWDLSRMPDRVEGEPVPEHPGYLPFPDRQVAAVEALARDIVFRNGIPAERVLAHSDVAPARKRDPGELFPWARLARAGVGAWVEPEPVGGGRFLARGETGEPIAALQAMFALMGYGLEITGVYDEALEQIVSAFQRHWRPARVDGVADQSTITTLHRLLTQARSAAAAA
ncbi:peptidoglycan recognition protein family protein [Prosthecomicrobium sp. N25]|uniref:peptidoglycan recognition protein family protein n=1 Tax=Prosthecomicrobium sp. N25 TaxID=3129254 RepID=UPI003077968A